MSELDSDVDLAEEVIPEEINHSLNQLSSSLHLLNMNESDTRSSESLENSWHVPIIGFEIMEERSKFTVYKLRVQNKFSQESWMIYRRYTDFLRLCTKIKSKYPEIVNLLPKKRYIRNNFDISFIKQRAEGLQHFLNCLLLHEDLLKERHVQHFLCLNDQFCNNLNKYRSFSSDLDSNSSMYSFNESMNNFNNFVKFQEQERVIVRLKNIIESQNILIKDVQEFLRNNIFNCDKCSLKLTEFENIKKLMNISNEEK